MIFYKSYIYKHFDPQSFLNFLPDIRQSIFTTYVCTRKEHDIIRSALNIDYRIFSALYFCIPPGISNQIHMDYKIGAKYYPKIALNIPLESCEDTTMYWYDSKDKTKETTMQGPSKGDLIPCLPNDNANLLKQVNFLNPTFITVDRWHNVKNYNKTEWAKMLSVRFMHPKYFKFT
jgi:hypothetical protein